MATGSAMRQRWLADGLRAGRSRMLALMTMAGARVGLRGGGRFSFDLLRAPRRSPSHARLEASPRYAAIGAAEGCEIVRGSPSLVTAATLTTS